MTGNRVEELEGDVQELRATVSGLTDELIETKERLRLIEDHFGPDLDDIINGTVTRTEARSELSGRSEKQGRAQGQGRAQNQEAVDASVAAVDAEPDHGGDQEPAADHAGDTAEEATDETTATEERTEEENAGSDDIIVA